MLIRVAPEHPIASSEITPEPVFQDRRRFLAQMGLATAGLALAVGEPWPSAAAALGLVLAAFSAGPLMGAVAGFSPSRDDIAQRHFYRLAATDLARTLCGGAWLLAQLLAQSMLALDAIVRGNKLIGGAWDKYKRLADIMRLDPAKYGVEPARAAAFDGLLADLDGSVFSGATLRRCLDQHLCGLVFHRLFFGQTQNRQRQRFDAAHAAVAIAARADDLAGFAQ